MTAKQIQLILLSILTLFAFSLGADTVYKEVDESGNVIFTDKPSDEDAEEIKIQKLDTIKNPNPAKYKPEQKKPVVNSNQYYNFVVVTPKHDEALRSNSGTVEILLLLEPGLDDSHTIKISMDGKEVGRGSSVTLENVDRGTHDISAVVVDGNNKTLISATSTFTLLRASK